MPGAREAFAKLQLYTSRKFAGLFALCDGPIGKGMLEAQAKMNAPWTDRTGNARQGLHGGAKIDEGDIVIYLAHSMEYGVYLEQSNAGKYAILKPTMEHNLEEIRKVVQEYWESNP